MKLFLKCEEAGHTCDKSQYKESGFFEKVLLNIHLLYCSACRKYVKRNTKLTRLIKKSQLKMMPVEQKLILKNRLRQEMSKY